MWFQKARGGVSLFKQGNLGFFLRRSTGTSSKSSNNDYNAVEEQYEGSVLQGFQSREHEFYHARSHDIMPRTAEELENSGQGVKENNTVVKEKEKEELEKYERLSSVSLRSVMQSNVPEPFNPHGKNPTHLNMPGGGVKLQEKYLSGNLQKVHPSRQFSTSARVNSQAAEIQEEVSYTDLPCPQGVQEYDCIQFKLWLQNCQRHNLDCDQMIDDFQSGRKTLAEIFAEQEAVIPSVAEGYRSPSGDLAGHEGLQSRDFARVENWLEDINRCVQGIQGPDCDRFLLWLHNCGLYNLGDCDRQLEDYREGRKTQSQIFQEQDQEVARISQQFQQQRHYSTSPKGSNEVSSSDPPTPEGSSSDPPISEEQLNQRQKLQRAIKEYGATVVVFHVCISLASLGGFYAAVSR